MWGIQYLSARQGGHFKRTILSSGVKKFSLLWRERHPSPNLSSGDYSGELLKGTSPQELQKVSKKDGIYHIKKILK